MAEPYQPMIEREVAAGLTTWLETAVQQVEHGRVFAIGTRPRGAPGAVTNHVYAVISADPPDG